MQGCNLNDQSDVQDKSQDVARFLRQRQTPRLCLILLGFYSLLVQVSEQTREQPGPVTQHWEQDKYATSVNLICEIIPKSNDKSHLIVTIFQA